MTPIPPLSFPLVVPNLQGSLQGSQKASPALYGESFSTLLEGVGKKTRDLLKSSEAHGKAAAAGEADPQIVSLEVLRAKEALHQLSVLVNTSLQAYQEVMHMAV